MKPDASHASIYHKFCNHLLMPFFVYQNGFNVRQQYKAMQTLKQSLWSIMMPDFGSQTVLWIPIQVLILTEGQRASTSKKEPLRLSPPWQPLPTRLVMQCSDRNIESEWILPQSICQKQPQRASHLKHIPNYYTRLVFTNTTPDHTLDHTPDLTIKYLNPNPQTVSAHYSGDPLFRESDRGTFRQ